jgi:hypothetical protein
LGNGKKRKGVGQMADQQDLVDGTLIRGPSGELYFISHDDLKAFKIRDESQAEVKENIKEFRYPRHSFIP